MQEGLGTRVGSLESGGRGKLPVLCRLLTREKSLGSRDVGVLGGSPGPELELGPPRDSPRTDHW